MKEKKTSSQKFPARFCAVFTGVYLVLYFLVGLFAHQENSWFDLLHRALVDKQGDPRIIIAAMDDDTVKKYGFPLPRRVHARLIDKLRSYGVKTIGFDIMFLEPGEGDKELIEATGRFKRVVHLALLEIPKPEDVARIKAAGGDLKGGYQAPTPGLEKTAQYLAYPNIDLVLDDDGHVRRARLFEPMVAGMNKGIPHAVALNVAALASFTGKPLKEYHDEFGGDPPREFRVFFRRPVEQKRHELADKAVINAGKLESPYLTLSYIDLLSGDLTPEQRKALKGALLLVGSTTLGYFDHYPSPFHSSVPGVEYHANIIDNLLHGDYIVDAEFEVTVVAMLLLIWIPFFLIRFSPALSAAGAGVTLAAWAGFCAWRFNNQVFVEFVTPAVALGVSFLALTVHRVLTEGQEKKFIKDLFGQFVAPEVVEDLARDPSKVKLGGEKRDMTMFFLDIAHFTTISEKMEPEKLLTFLNKYLSALSYVVHEQGGVVDKYIGDCIMAFWNAPLPVPDHRVRACLAAIDCQAAIQVLNKDIDPSVGEVPAIRIGLNSGTVTVGLTGSEKKLQYTVIGDEVNLASRLEGANKFFGSGIMAAQSTYDGAKDLVEARELGRVRVVGKATPIKVYELLSRKGQLSAEWQKALPLYEKALALFQGAKYHEAAAAFEEVLKIFPGDGPCEFYLNTSRDYSAIPPDNWDGVINLTAK